MSFPWQNDSAELEAMEELPGGILDSTPSPTPSPASTRASSPTPPRSPEPEVGTRPTMGIQAPKLPPLMPSYLSTSTTEQIGRSNRPIAGKPPTFSSSGRSASSLAPGMQAGPSGSSRPPASRLPVKSGEIQESSPFKMPARTLSAVALGKQPCRSGSTINVAQQDAYQQASGSNRPSSSSHNQQPTSNLATTVTQTDSDDEAAADAASAPRATRNDGYESDDSDVSYVEVAISTPVASGSTPVAEPDSPTNPATASQPLEQPGRPRMEGTSSSPPAGLSEVALGKQRCMSPDVPTSVGQQASQSGARGAGSASTMAPGFPLKAATPSINKLKWASPSSYRSKWATAPAPRYTSKWATPQPEDVPDADEQSGGEEQFDAFDENLEEEDIDDGEMSGVEEYMDEDEVENEDDGMMFDEDERHQDDDNDDMVVDEEERADETEDVDMEVDDLEDDDYGMQIDPEDEDYGMQVDPEPPFAAPKEPPAPPQPSDFRYHFHSPPAPQQQETRFPELRPFFQYFAPQPQPTLFASNPVFTESRQEARYPQTSQSMPAPACMQPSHPYTHGQQPYTPCASYVPYHPPQQPFQPYHSTPSSNYAQFPPTPTYFYPFHNQTTTPSYTYTQFSYHNSQTYSGQLRFEDNYYAREGGQTQQYTDEHQPKQSFAQAFVATVRRLLNRREGREDDVQKRNEKCVNFVEHESRRFEDHTDETEEEEENEQEEEEDEDNQLQVQIIGAHKPDAKQARHVPDARQDRQHEGMLENLAKKTGRLIQENKWITLPAIGLAVYSFAPTLVGLFTSG